MIVLVSLSASQLSQGQHADELVFSRPWLSILPPRLRQWMEHRLAPCLRCFGSSGCGKSIARAFSPAFVPLVGLRTTGGNRNAPAAAAAPTQQNELCHRSGFPRRFCGSHSSRHRLLVRPEWIRCTLDFFTTYLVMVPPPRSQELPSEGSAG